MTSELGLAVCLLSPSVPSVCPPTVAVSRTSLLVAVTHSKCGPALRCQTRPVGAAVQCKGDGGKRKGGACMPGGVVEGPQKPRRPCRPRTVPRLPAPFATVKAELAGQPARGSNRRVHAAPRCGAGHSGGIHRLRRASGIRARAAVGHSPLAALAESSDRRDPALPWNALGCVGAGAPALSLARVFFTRPGEQSSGRPSLQTHFGWRPAINSELARTRGIRLSN